MDNTSRMDGFVAELEAKAKDAATLRDIANRSPDLIIQFAAELQSNLPKRSESGKTNVDLVSDFLRTQKQPVETACISHATGLAQSAVRTILYSGREKQFIPMPHPEHSTKRMWKLAEKGRPEKHNKATAVAESNGLVGTTKGVKDYLGRHPKGATANAIIKGIISHIRSDAENKSSVIYGTIASLERRKKIKSEIDMTSGLKVYRLFQ